MTRQLITRATVGKKHANYQEEAGQSKYKRESVQKTSHYVRKDDESVGHFDLFLLLFFIDHCPLVSTDLSIQNDRFIYLRSFPIKKCGSVTSLPSALLIVDGCCLSVLPFRGQQKKIRISSVLFCFFICSLRRFHLSRALISGENLLILPFTDFSTLSSHTNVNVR